MNYKTLIATAILATSGAASAAIETIASENSVYPLDTTLVTNVNDLGQSNLSISTRVGQGKAVDANAQINDLKPQYISYGRGVGKIPGEKGCEAPATENDWGLCYVPCEADFKGVGPMCHGKFDKEVIGKRLQEIQAKHGSKSGFAGDKPVFSTDIMFHKAMCTSFIPQGLIPAGAPLSSEIAGLTNLAGLLNMTNQGWAKLTGLINGKINGAIQESAAKTLGNSAIASALELVLFDFKFNANCDSDAAANTLTASVSLDTSVTINADTKIFDPVLHQVSTMPGGAIPGVANVSIYELIPFRVYGTIAFTAGANTEFKAVYDNNNQVFSPAKVVFNGATATGKTQVANNTQFSITPAIDLGLGLEAYLRIPSMVEAIPDILQLGANMNLNVFKWSLPFVLSEQLGNGGERPVVLSQEKSLRSILKAGDGNLKPFFRLFGKAINVFGDKANIKWEAFHSVRHLVI